MDWSQIGERVSIVEFGFVTRYELRRAAGEDAIINVNGEDDGVSFGLCKEDSWVCRTRAEAQVSEGAGEGVIPFSPRLFEPIKRFVKSLDCVLPLSFISRWLVHVKFFIVVECAIEVGTIEVKRLNVPIEACGHS